MNKIVEFAFPDSLLRKEYLMNNATTLSSIAMLKVNIDSGKDYLEYLRPYVLQVLVDSPPDVVTDASVALLINEICGLVIPKRTIQILLRRLAKDGCLSRENGIYTIVGKLPISSNLSIKSEAERKISIINKELSKFAKESAGRNITEEEASECLVAFLSKFSIPCLKSYLRGTTLPSGTGHNDWQVRLVGQFVSELTLKIELFDNFMTLVQGNMLANALLCPDLNSVSNSYDDVVFYFDTPLLIQLLGLDGEQEKQAIEEVVNLVQRLNGTVAYFNHTFDELYNSIIISADYIDSPKGRGTIVNEARKSGRSKSDLLLMAEHAANSLAAFKIHSVQAPLYDEKNHKFEISEQVFGAVLDDAVNYHNPRAKEYDIQSVRSIYVLRKGNSPVSIEKSRAVLVTNNSGYAKAAYEYGKKFEQSREISAVITDFSLANTAWLKAPQGAPSLPRKEVLAFAYAMLRPTNDFWDKVLDEAEKLELNGTISARDHQLLRSNHHVQNELMKLTLGDDAALTETSIKETLRRVTEEIRTEDAIKLQQSEDKRAFLAKELEDKIAKEEVIKEKIYWRCDKRAKREALAISALIWFMQLAVALFGLVKIPEGSKFGWVMIAVGVFSGVIRIAGAYFDIKPLNVFFKYKEWRRSWLERREYEYLSIDRSVGAISEASPKETSFGA